MFETSFVRERVAPRRRAGVFVASIVAHTVAVAGILIATATATTLPTNAPNETMKVYFAPAEPPLPRGNPDAPRQPQAPPQRPQQQAAQPHVQTAPQADTTPSLIPNTIPTVASTSTSSDITPGNGNNTGNERWGVKDGDPNGVDVGQTNTNVSVGTPDVVFHPGVDVKSAIVVYRVQPNYPPLASRMHLSGWVFVKCIIGKNGEIRDAEVEKSSNTLFDQPALEALRQWKFVPGYYKGQPVDTYFELKITFEVR